MNTAKGPDTLQQCAQFLSNSVCPPRNFAHNNSKIKWLSSNRAGYTLLSCFTQCCTVSPRIFNLYFMCASWTNHLSVFISGEIPPYHYGTHYSSTMIVASYLIRLEPFTQHFLRVQVIVMCLFFVPYLPILLHLSRRFDQMGTFLTFPPDPLPSPSLLRGGIFRKKD